MAAKVAMVAVPTVLGIASIRVYTVKDAPADGLVSRDRLNVYAPLPSADPPKVVPESPGLIERGLTTTRESVLPAVRAVKGACVSVKRSSVNLYHAGEDVYYYLIDPPPGFPPRFGTVTMAGLLGMFLTRKGSRFKRLAVPLGLMSAGASVCYPAQAVSVLKVTGQKVYAAGQWSAAAASSLLAAREPVAKEAAASQTQPPSEADPESALRQEEASADLSTPDLLAKSAAVLETEVESAESVPISDEPAATEEPPVALTGISPAERGTAFIPPSPAPSVSTGLLRLLETLRFFSLSLSLSLVQVGQQIWSQCKQSRLVPPQTRPRMETERRTMFPLTRRQRPPSRTSQLKETCHQHPLSNRLLSLSRRRSSSRFLLWRRRQPQRLSRRRPLQREAEKRAPVSSQTRLSWTSASPAPKMKTCTAHEAETGQPQPRLASTDSPSDVSILIVFFLSFFVCFVFSARVSTEHVRIIWHWRCIVMNFGTQTQRNLEKKKKPKKTQTPTITLETAECGTVSVQTCRSFPTINYAKCRLFIVIQPIFVNLKFPLRRRLTEDLCCFTLLDGWLRNSE